MVSRLIAAALGIAAMALAPAAAAAFPEDFVPRSASSVSSAASSESSSVSSAGTGASALSVSSASSVSSAAPASSVSSAPADEEEKKGDSIGEAAKLAAQEQMTRAQFTALIVEKVYSQAELDRCYWDIASSVPPRFTLVFTDVHVNDRFARHICVAMRNGLVRGQGDGSFRPDQKITFAESAKILARAFVLTPYADANRLQPWYREYTEALADRNAIPLSIDRMDHLVTAGEAAEMFTRVAMGTTTLPSRTYDDLQPRPRKPAAAVKPRPSPKPSSAAASSVSSAPASSAAISSESSSSKKPFWNPF